MTSHKIKLFAMILLPLALQSAAITNWNQQLLRAAAAGNLELVNDAIKNGADVNFFLADDYFTRTPLHFAAEEGHTKVVKALILAKADTNSRIFMNWTPLFSAARCGHNDTITLLISAKAIIDNRCSHSQWTPLHLAAYRCHTETVKLFLKNGADINLTDKDNKTIFEIINEGYENQIKKDEIKSIIFNKLLLVKIPEYFFELREKLNIPAPLVNIITQYICDSTENNQNLNDRVKQ